MQYSLSLDDESKIYTVKVTGSVKRPNDTITLQQLAQSLYQKNDIYRFLIDMRDAEIITSPADEYEAAIMPRDQDIPLYALRFASVFSGDLKQHKFMETVAVNRGFQVRVFDDMHDAYYWLCEPDN